MKYFMAFFLFGLLLVSCESEDVNLGSAFDYMPSVNQLSQGLVSKYYVHNKETGNDHYKTDINYIFNQITEDQLIQKKYNAGFDLKETKEFLLSDDQWILNEHYTNYPDTQIYFQIIDSVYYDWQKDGSLLQRKRVYSDRNVIWNHKQHSRIDTLFENRKSKVFNVEFEQIIELMDDTTVSNASVQRMFASGLGMAHTIWKSNAKEVELILDELMTLSEFERRADHGMHRVAYIDPEIALYKDSGFTTCKSIDRIFDYYNGANDRARFIGDKGAIRQLLSEQLDESLIENESGYLTFRFVINCNGEAGRFITEEADLDFNQKSFSNACRDHLYQIISGVDQWQPLILSGEMQDSYMYITFKLKDGEIIELLP